MPILLNYFRKSNSLKAVILTNNSFNDRCVEEFCKVLKYSSVETIDFSGNLMTSVSL